MKFTKTIGLVSGLILAATATQAQQMPTSIFEKSKIGQTIKNKPGYIPNFNILAGKTNKQVAKPTADTFMRPIAFTNQLFHDTTMVNVDSAFFTWKGNHGTNVNIYNYEAFNIFWSIPINPYSNLASLINYADEYVYNMSFEQTPKLSTIDYYYFDNDTVYIDNIKYHYDTTETLLEYISHNTDSTIFEYDNNGRTTKKVVYNPNYTFTYSATYDTNNNVTNFYMYGSNSDSSHYSYEYDTANKLIRKSFVNYYLSNLNNGSIDSIFALSNTVDSHVIYSNWGSTWNRSDIFKVTKNANKDNILIQDYDANTLTNYGALYINRNTNGEPENIYYISGTDTTNHYEVKHNNNGDLLELTLKSNYGVGYLMNESKQTITYNAENLPILVQYQENYDDSSNTWVPGYGDIATKIYYEKIGIEDTSTSVGKITRTQVSLYPNPAQDQLNISVENETIKGIAIYDAMGRIMRTYQIANKGNLDLNISTLTTGNYTIQVLTNKGTSTAKFVKK